MKVLSSEVDDIALESWLKSYEDSFHFSPESRELAAATVPGLDAVRTSQLRHCLDLLDRVWPGSTVPTPHSFPDSVLTALLRKPDGRGSVDAIANSSVRRRSGPQVPDYEIFEILGRGGMGIVYRARRVTGPERDVVLKVLPPGFASDPERLQRFRTEAEVAARFTDSRILPLLDLIETESGPVLVMPYVAGTDLGRIISNRAAVRGGAPSPGPNTWSGCSDHEYLGRILPVLDKVIEAVTAVHAAGVLHRDIKPSNILIDEQNNVWLTDFGLARVGQGAGLTCPGRAMGTPGFMSPEHWDEESGPDHRGDIFSLAATLYQALTLKKPFGDARVEVNSILPVSSRKLQPLLSRDLDSVVLHGLEPRVENRYQAASELREDWQLTRNRLTPLYASRGRMVRRFRRLHSNYWKAAALLLVGLLAGAIFVPHQKTAELSVPPDRESPGVDARRTVLISTDPPGAQITLVPKDGYGELNPARLLRSNPGETTPLTMRVPPGEYLVVANIPNYGFHEVYRIVPGPEDVPGLYLPQRWRLAEDGAVRFPLVRIKSEALTRADMAAFPGGAFVMGPDVPTGTTGSPAHERFVAPFLLDTAEVNVSDYQGNGRKIPDIFLNSFQKKPLKLKTYAVGGVSFEQALEYAELVGKRLPSEAEYEFAATNGGATSYPWGNEPTGNTDWPHGPVRALEFDRTMTTPPVFGLYSNVAEWCDSMCIAYDPKYHPNVAKYPAAIVANLLMSRVVRGAPPLTPRRNAPNQNQSFDTSKLTARFRQMRRCEDFDVTLGFRCARSLEPRFQE